jgi:hypothetical protein
VKNACANPPGWVDEILAANWTSLCKRVDRDLLPVGSPVALWQPLGCGSYGCVYNTSVADVVFKITTDNSEAEFVALTSALNLKHEGVVRYHDIVRVPGRHEVPGHDEPAQVHLLWRERAYAIGDVKRLSEECERQSRRPGWTRLVANCESVHVFRNVLREYKNAAVIMRKASLSGWDNMSAIPMIMPTIKERSKRLAGDVSLLSGKTLVLRGLDLESAWTLDGLALLWAGLELCAATLRSEPDSRLVGEALTYYMDNDMLLADVHSKNVGKVRRTRDERTDPWVITDPGHLVLLREFNVPAHVETLGELSVRSRVA